MLYPTELHPPKKFNSSKQTYCISTVLFVNITLDILRPSFRARSRNLLKNCHSRKNSLDIPAALWYNTAPEWGHGPKASSLPLPLIYLPLCGRVSNAHRTKMQQLLLLNLCHWPRTTCPHLPPESRLRRPLENLLPAPEMPELLPLTCLQPQKTCTPPHTSHPRTIRHSRCRRLPSSQPVHLVRRRCP